MRKEAIHVGSRVKVGEQIASHVMVSHRPGRLASAYNRRCGIQGRRQDEFSTSLNST